MLTPKDIAAWHRERARRHNQMAEMIEGDLGFGGNTGRKAREKESELSAPGTVNAEQLEARIGRKKARIRDLTQEFGVTEQAIRALLDPAKSKVELGQRGWLQLRQ